MVPSRAEWRGETDNRATPPVGYCPSTASFSVRPYCKNARRDRCQEYHNCFPFGGLEETSRTSSNYVDEDYLARPEIKQPLTGWGDNCGSESSTLETDVCVWRYAPLVVHATQEEEEITLTYPYSIKQCKFDTYYSYLVGLEQAWSCCPVQPYQEEASSQAELELKQISSELFNWTSVMACQSHTLAAMSQFHIYHYTHNAHNIPYLVCKYSSWWASFHVYHRLAGSTIQGC